MDKNKNTSGLQSIISKTVLSVLFCLGLGCGLSAQKKLPVIKATDANAVIIDGGSKKFGWGLDPKLKPDTYYVNFPSKRHKVTLKTDQDKISFKTKYGESYDFVVLLNGTDSCFNRIVAKEAPTPITMESDLIYPQSIPFTLIGSRIYFQGHINGQKEAVTIQYDTGAGASCINKMSSDKLQLSFTGKTIVNNTQGINETRVSNANTLAIAGFTWTGLPLVEVGNMREYEDLIVGNGIFQDKIIEVDYDKKLFIVHDKLPAYIKDYKKQKGFFEKGGIKTVINQNGKKYRSRFGFDTGRDGAMRIGPDFTGQDRNWENLQEMQMVNGRKIVRLDAKISGVEFKDIVTNAAAPSDPQGRASIFGNQILNHFNFILDNTKGELYLKPNGRKDEPYYNYDSYLKELEIYLKETSK